MKVIVERNDGVQLTYVGTESMVVRYLTLYLDPSPPSGGDRCLRKIEKWVRFTVEKEPGKGEV